MRRTALYLGGLLLATGASLALAGPASAAPSGHGCCRDDDEQILVVSSADDDYYCDDDDADVLVLGGNGHRRPYKKHWFGGGGHDGISQYNSTDQVGLVNLNSTKQAGGSILGIL
jgi:hypothetical protein